MLSFTIIVLLFFLASQVFTVAIGIEPKHLGAKSALFIISLGLSQGLLFWLGYSLGASFMHLMDGFKSFVVFAMLFLIAIRMLMESYQVWKGERIYILDNLRVVLIAGLAQGVNTFLAGLLFVYLPYEKNSLTLAILIFALLFSLLGAFVKSTKNSITFAALMFVLGGLVTAFSSIYISFFAL